MNKDFLAKNHLGIYCCQINGQTCEMAQEHFAKIARAVEYNAKRKNNYVFFTSEPTDGYCIGRFKCALAIKQNQMNQR